MYQTRTNNSPPSSSYSFYMNMCKLDDVHLKHGAGEEGEGSRYQPRDFKLCPLTFMCTENLKRQLCR